MRTFSGSVQRQTVTVTAWLLLSTALPAQDTAPSFGETIDVRVINVEAVVTDQTGERVPGLEAEDFRLLVDGREADVAYFTEVNAGKAVAQQTPNPPLDVPGLTPSSQVGSSLLIFIDDYFAMKRDRDPAIDQLIANLPMLAGQDRMAIVAFAGRKLELLCDWTSDQAKLREALEGAKKRKPKGLQQEVFIRSTPVGLGAPTASRYRALRLRDSMRRVVLAATTALRSFSNAPGRRAMVLMAGGWPYNAPPRVIDSGFPASRWGRRLDYGPSLYRSLYDTANLTGYTLYTVDLRRSRGIAGGSAEFRTGAAARQAVWRAAERDINENNTLTRLAEETGGQAFLNASSRFAFEQALSDTRSYYWLGFIPNLRGTDRRHEIRIELRQPGLDVRTRRSFSDLSRKTEVTMLAEGALLFGNPTGSEQLMVEVGTSDSAGLRKMLLPLEIFIPLDRVTVLRHQGGWSTALELRVAVEDKHGDRNEILVTPVTLPAFPDRPPPGAVIVYETSLKMRRLRHKLVVSIHDKGASEVLWTKLEVGPS